MAVESLGLTTEAFNFDNMIAGFNQGPIDSGITLISGQNLVRGSLLGKITASGKYTLSLTASGDGSEVPIRILERDTDATAGDILTSAWEAGEFDESKLTYGAAHTSASVREGLRVLSIYLKTVLQVDGQLSS